MRVSISKNDGADIRRPAWKATVPMVGYVVWILLVVNHLVPFLLDSTSEIHLAHFELGKMSYRYHQPEFEEVLDEDLSQLRGSYGPSDGLVAVRDGLFRGNDHVSTGSYAYENYRAYAPSYAGYTGKSANIGTDVGIVPKHIDSAKAAAARSTTAKGCTPADAQNLSPLAKSLCRRTGLNPEATPFVPSQQERSSDFGGTSLGPALTRVGVDLPRRSMPVAASAQTSRPARVDDSKVGDGDCYNNLSSLDAGERGRSSDGHSGHADRSARRGGWISRSVGSAHREARSADRGPHASDGRLVDEH